MMPVVGLGHFEVNMNIEQETYCIFPLKKK